MRANSAEYTKPYWAMLSLCGTIFWTSPLLVSQMCIAVKKTQYLHVLFRSGSFSLTCRASKERVPSSFTDGGMNASSCAIDYEWMLFCLHARSPWSYDAAGQSHPEPLPNFKLRVRVGTCKSICLVRFTSRLYGGHIPRCIAR